MPDVPTPNNSAPIDATTISNAILFCQNSIELLAAGRSMLNPLGISPAIFQIADSIGQLQNSMLDLLNWATEVDKRLAGLSE
jgi:hypothetical protein